MRAMLSRLLKAMLLTALLCTVRTAHAQAITVDLSTLAQGSLLPSTVIDALPGDLIDFFGILTNTLAADPSGANDLVMDSVGGNLLGPSSDVTLDATDYYTNFSLFDPANPGLIQAQQTLPAGGTARIFTVTVASTAAPGTYFGTFDIFDSNANILGEAPFTLQVNSPADTPEPAASVFLLCSASSLLLVMRRKHRARRTL
jgi:hypothetical protein